MVPEKFFSLKTKVQTKECFVNSVWFLQIQKFVLSLSLIAKSDLCGASRTILILHDEKPCHLQISTFKVPFLKKKTVCISLHELF
jgi:hypothetical protein